MAKSKYKLFHRNQIGRAQRYIRTHFSEQVTVSMIAKEAGASMFHFGRLFLAYTNETPFDFLRRVRTLTAMGMLQEDRYASITEIGLSVGYSTPSAFNKAFKYLVKINPSEFRNLGKDEQVSLIYSLSKPVTQEESMNLNLKYTIIKRDSLNYLFLEDRGSFQEIAQPLWDKLFPILFSQLDQSVATEFLGLSIIDKTKSGEESLVYQAGVCVPLVPKGLKNISAKKIPAGKYARFEIRGSYGQIWKAFNQIFKILTENKIHLREEFCIENYLNDPKITPEEDLITEILVPIE